MHLVDQYEKQGKLEAEAAVQRAFADAAENLKAAGHVLSLFVDTSIPSDASFAAVKEKAFSLLEPARFPLVSDYMRNIAFDKIGFQWAYYSTLSPTFKLAENVPGVPDICIDGYSWQRLDLNAADFGSRQRRLRHVQFGSRDGTQLMILPSDSKIVYFIS